MNWASPHPDLPPYEIFSLKSQEFIIGNEFERNEEEITVTDDYFEVEDELYDR